MKQSLQKKKKKQQKSAEKWNERTEATEKMKVERQQKRSENIAERSHQKKMIWIEKREKKFMRPGFEGHKEGYINQGGSLGCHAFELCVHFWFLSVHMIH